jgi:predicted phosphoribosyltransferase
MRAGIATLRLREPSSIVVAVPVAPPETVDVLRAEADEVVCLETPEPFWAIGQWYEDFGQVSDDEVRGQLFQAWAPEKQCQS